MQKQVQLESGASVSACKVPFLAIPDTESLTLHLFEAKFVVSRHIAVESTSDLLMSHTSKSCNTIYRGRVSAGQNFESGIAVPIQLPDSFSSLE